MAITSDAIYNARTAVPPLMSLNLYYGYVPHCRKETQFNAMFEHAEITKPSVLNRDPYDTAMETDDNECHYSIVPRYLNSDSLNLETSMQNWFKTNNKQPQQWAAYNEDTLQRRNRKRCNNDLSSSNQVKKFRSGGGKDYAHCNTGSTKDYGSTVVPYEPEALHVNTVNNKLEQFMFANKSYCWAGDNHDLLENSDYKQIFSDNGHKSVENNVEYERLLFETHGCSLYQFHRLQLVNNDCSEAEF